MRILFTLLAAGILGCGSPSSSPDGGSTLPSDGGSDQAVVGDAALAVDATSPPDGDTTHTFTFDFDQGLAGWVAGFADYPLGMESFYELDSGQRALPAPLDVGKKGFYLSGNNHSDDLFMYLRGPVAGLSPSTRYAVEIELEVGTNAPSGCLGVGGTPGESVTMKAGAVGFEPVPATLGHGVDKGNQSVGGKDVLAVGTIGNSNTDCNKPRYELKRFTTAGTAFEATTGADGVLWALVGTDSGFEATTSLYYTSVRITATRR